MTATIFARTNDMSRPGHKAQLVIKLQQRAGAPPDPVSLLAAAVKIYVHDKVGAVSRRRERSTPL